MGRLTRNADAGAYSYRTDSGVPPFPDDKPRDKLYGVLARNRLEWFGSGEACFVPDPSDADRFIV